MFGSCLVLIILYYLDLNRNYHNLVIKCKFNQIVYSIKWRNFDIIVFGEHYKGTSLPVISGCVSLIVFNSRLK